MNAPLRRAASYALGFVVVAALVVLGATRGVDRALLGLAQSIASGPLDVAASLVTILGQTEVTGVIAVALAIVWWRHEGIRGLVPLLMFAGVASEYVLKLVLPHPVPPAELSRSVDLLPFLSSGARYAFPSGHTLRATFLAALVVARAPAWRWPLAALVVVMAFTRVYLAQHWASDVLGGILLGLALAEVAVAWRRA